MNFKVIDNTTGKEADTWNIALHEEWAQNLIYCDMEGFAITEDGNLVLMDECGNVVYCDPERFKVVFEEERPHGEWVACEDTEFCKCSKCETVVMLEESVRFHFCPDCGTSMMKEGEKSGS